MYIDPQKIYKCPLWLGAFVTRDRVGEKAKRDNSESGDANYERNTPQGTIWKEIPVSQRDN